VLAQDVVPAWTGFHSWQYAVVLVATLAGLFGYMRSARRGEDGELGKRLWPAAAGAIVIVVAGLASGLLGPDTETVARAPGTVAVLPDVGAAAFFPIANAAGIANGDSHVELRRRNAAELDIGPGERRYVGATVLELDAEPAAYLEARDQRGNRLTITQPTNAAFLSPVLLFPQKVSIAGHELPADEFATPAADRRIRVFYFSADSAAAGARHGLRPGPSVLFAVDDGGGRLQPAGIGFAQNGDDVLLAGLRLRATLGTYPALVISAVPFPPALWAGGALLAGGLAYAFWSTWFAGLVTNNTRSEATVPPSASR
jgi:hypothetical protein